MTGVVPTKAMLLAAGLGTRLRPMTENRPKPLIEVDGRALIDHTLDRLQETGVGEVVINTHYLAEQLEGHLTGRKAPKIEFSRETDLLDTGGGIKQALAFFGDAPFFAVNTDALWLNGPFDALSRMAATWNDKTMDGLLLLHSTIDAYGYTGTGDFNADGDGKLVRRLESEVSPWLFTGIQMLHPRLFKGAPEGAFSLNHLYDKAMEDGRLFGAVHDGEWFHVGTPEGLQQAETYMQIRYAGIRRR